MSVQYNISVVFDIFTQRTSFFQAVLQDQQNGPIKRYYVTYWLLSNISQPIGEEVIDNLDLQVNITDLDPWTWYMFKVTPENAGGRGQPSEPVNARTFPTGSYSLIQNCFIYISVKVFFLDQTCK